MANDVTFREEELQEIDKYDILNTDIFYPYVQRLEKADKLLRTQVSIDPLDIYNLRKRLLEKSGLIGGSTNFWDNPSRYMAPTSQLRHDLSLRGSGTEAYVENNPYNIMFNPSPRQGQSPTPRILAHEGAHQPYIRNWIREIKKQLGQKLDYPVVKWEPNFSVGFLRDIDKINELGHPLYGNKLGPHYISEVMSYLIGREGELRSKQTLKDDPVVGKLFASHPGMYEEYVRSRDLLLNIK